MSTSDPSANPESVAREYFAAVARRDVGAMVACWEPGSRDVIHGIADLSVPDGLRTWFDALFAAFPDFAFEVLDVLPAGDKAAVRWRATGTFDGAGRFEGMIANGSRVDVQGCDVLSVRDGKVHHNDAYTNAADLARQLGALPPVGSPPERALTSLLNVKTRLIRRLARSRS